MLPFVYPIVQRGWRNFIPQNWRYSSPFSHVTLAVELVTAGDIYYVYRRMGRDHTRTNVPSSSTTSEEPDANDDVTTTRQHQLLPQRNIAMGSNGSDGSDELRLGRYVTATSNAFLVISSSSFSWGGSRTRWMSTCPGIHNPDLTVKDGIPTPASTV